MKQDARQRQGRQAFSFGGENAGQVFAHREAIVLAQRGLKLLDSAPKSPERDELELALQMALGLQFQLTEGYASDPAKQAYDRARELCQSTGTSKTLFPILWGLWLHYKVRSQLPRAQELADELLAQARTLNNPDLALQAHQALGMTALCRGEQGTCLRHVEQVASIYNPTRHGEHAALFGQDPSVMCKSFGAIALWLLGFPDAARRQSEAAIALEPPAFADHANRSRCTSPPCFASFAATPGRRGDMPKRRPRSPPSTGCRSGWPAAAC